MIFGRKPHTATSLGNLLQEAGLVTQDEVLRAQEYQEQNPDVMLGEALVHMDVISRDQLEVILARQTVARSNGSGKGVAKLADLASERVQRLTDRAERALSRKAVAK